MAELVGGAVLGTFLAEMILLAKKARRCKEDCENLAATLEHLEPLLSNALRSANGGNAKCREWLQNVRTLLVEAECVLGHCGVKKSVFSMTKYLPRWNLSPKLQNIKNRILETISLGGVLVNIDIALGIDQKLTGISVASCVQPPPFQKQDVPRFIAASNNNPFEELKNLVLSTPDYDTRSIGVKGGGGVGKTLLAKMVNNNEEVQKRYGSSSILYSTIGYDVSVSEVYKRIGKFLGDGGVFEKDICGGNLEEQRTYLIQAFKRRKVLVILDDVWEKVENSRTMIEWLDIFKGEGSTTLITTRNNEVLNGAKVMKAVEVGLLSEEESWKLFSFHAFQPNMPPSSEVEVIAKKICTECKGLPLALKVIGGALYNKKDEARWNIALCRLKNSEVLANSASSECELFDRLKFSYDDLGEDAKKCFLYFAAFPEDYQIPTKELCSIWQAEKLFGPQNVEVAMYTGMMYLSALADQSLIELDEDGNHAKIHDILRDLAIRILRDAKTGEWAHECHFQAGKVLDTFPKIDVSTKRVSFVGSHIQNLNTKMSFEGKNMVHVCLLSDITFICNGASNSFCRNIWLGMTSLVYLDLCENKSLKELPESIKELKSLTHLELRGCSSLRELPKSITELKSLTHLDLSRWLFLKELPESIKELKSLTHLDLSWCSSLKELPESIKELKSLTDLDLNRCMSLKELPESIKELKSLTHFYLSWCVDLKELPESIKELKSLTHLELVGCRFLKEHPESFKELKSLTHLDLSWCTSLLELPKSITELKSLTHLDLSRCLDLKELPESISELKSLTHLDLSRCLVLKELPESIKELNSLTHLDLCECISLEKLPKSITELKSLTHLKLSGWYFLKVLPESITELKSLTHLDLSGCPFLKELPKSIKELKSLTHLDLCECYSLEELPESIKELKSLTHLDLRGCTSLKELPESIKEL